MMGCSSSLENKQAILPPKPGNTVGQIRIESNADLGVSAVQSLAHSINNGGQGPATTSSSNRQSKNLLALIDWSELTITGKDAESAVIGHGSFGTVIRAVYRPSKGVANDGTCTTSNSPSTSHGSQQNATYDVAVKVLTRTLVQMSDADFDQICERAIEEVELIREAGKNMLYPDCIVKAYGVARGSLPAALCSMFRITSGDEGVGIVMRYEGGGSLEGLLKQARETRAPIPMHEKLRLLRGVARGLAELHSIGLVHSDIKPENVLLNTESPPEVRLADFGLAIMRNDTLADGIRVSTLVATSHLRGTPIYCAPEMLVNPYVEFEGTVAKSSRKTDMYAFAMLGWEVLTQQKPFTEITSEGVLCSRVHKGYRPPIESLPRDTPKEVIALITACWDRDRSVRKSAVEAFSLLNFILHNIVQAKGPLPEVFISHSPAMRPCLDHVVHHLTQFGYRVYYDQTYDVKEPMNPDRAKALKAVLSSCKILVCCIDQSYQTTEGCMYELRLAHKLSPAKPVLALVMEENPLNWTNDETAELCQLRSSVFVDISRSASHAWGRDEGPDAEMLAGLNKSLQPLLRLLSDAGCHNDMQAIQNGKSGLPARY